MKACKRCGEPKHVDEFYTSSASRDGRRASCKRCTLEMNKVSVRKNPSAAKRAKEKYAAANIEKTRQIHRDYWKGREVQNRENGKRYRLRHPERVREFARRSRKNCRESIAKRNRERIQRDSRYRLRVRFSSMFSRRMKRHAVGTRGGRSCFSALPYTVEELIEHLEGLFLPGMSWANYGQWHVDHRRPDSLFEYKSTSDQEFQECWALSNLQPMWALDNIRKGNKVLREEAF